MSAATTRKFFKQTFTITVLTEGVPLSENIEAEDLAYEITDGASISGQLVCATEAIDGPATAGLLLAWGSIPAFFHLTETGQELEDD